MQKNELRAQLAQIRLGLGRLKRELTEARVELVRQNLIDVLESSPSPSAMKRDPSILDCCGLGENCRAEADAPSEFSGSYLFKTFPNRDRQEIYRFARSA